MTALGFGRAQPGWRFWLLWMSASFAGVIVYAVTIPVIMGAINSLAPAQQVENLAPEQRWIAIAISLFANAARGGANRIQQRLAIGVFEQVAARPSAQAPYHPLVLVVCRQNDDGHVWLLRANLLDRGQPIHARYLQIHQYYVRLEFVGQLHCLRAIDRFADKFEFLTSICMIRWMWNGCTV
jgi:hypothetical protein